MVALTLRTSDSLQATAMADRSLVLAQPGERRATVRVLELTEIVRFSNLVELL